MRVVVLDHPTGDPSLEAEVARLHGATFEHRPHARTRDEVIAATARADIVLADRVTLDADALGGLAHGATVICYGVGMDHVDLDAAAIHGINVLNIPDYATETVAEHATALILMLTRHIAIFDRAVRDSGWSGPQQTGPIVGFREATVGLLGTGRIGRALARNLRSLGFQIIAHDAYLSDEKVREVAEPVDLPTLFSRADVLSLHLPSTSETRGIIGRHAIGMMKPGAHLVNTSRGALVDEDALVEALETGRIAAAALDVFVEEPLGADSRLRKLAGVVLTPHVGYYSETSLRRLREEAAAHVARILDAHPQDGQPGQLLPAP